MKHILIKVTDLETKSALSKQYMLETGKMAVTFGKTEKVRKIKKAPH
jgi:hypothetical protein